MPKTICEEFFCYDCIKNRENGDCNLNVRDGLGIVRKEFLSACPLKCPRREPEDIKVVFDPTAGKRAEKNGFGKKKK